MEEKNYASFDLPPYFTFQELLNETAKEIKNKNLIELCRVEPIGDGSANRATLPKYVDGVNYKILASKDGEFAWRPFEVIHPVLYVMLVNTMTDKNNWAEILSVFEKFKTSCVSCESVPVKSDDEQSHKAKQITRWWENIERASIKMGLRFQHVCDVDVSDCYGSIYTHSITWALHGKETMKEAVKKGKTGNYLGQKIDNLIQNMRFAQTNGIPQGSVIMDFIAEILFGHIDLELTERLRHIHKDEFSILRYRDDYKIFTNDPELGREIIKELTQLLSEYGLKLNTSKTKIQSDPVFASVKADKIYELELPKNKVSLSKRLLFLYSIIDKHPNSGMSARLLDGYLKRLQAVKKIDEYDDVEAMISMTVNLATKNPRTHAVTMGILSHLLSFCTDDRKAQLIVQISAKFERVPNTGLLDIWLQRVTYKIDPTIQYDEKLTKVVTGEMGNLFWRSGWLKDDLLAVIMKTSIIDKVKLAELSPTMSPEEVSLYSFIS